MGRPHRIARRNVDGKPFRFLDGSTAATDGGLKKPFALDSNLQRIEDTEMHAAIREALANALVHSDYYGRRGIVALRYSDRIEIANPGNSRVALDVVRAGGISDAAQSDSDANVRAYQRL